MYCIRKTEHGIRVDGPVPISHVDGLFSIFKEENCEILDLAVAGELGATFAATTEKGSELWRASLEIAEGGKREDIP